MLNIESKIKVKPLDIIIFLIGVALIVFSIKSLGNKKNGEKYVIVAVLGDEYIYPLNKNMRKDFEGAEGISTIVIENGKAFFEESCCPNKTCVQSSPLSHPNEWSACLPNQVFLRIDGTSEEMDVLVE